MDWCERCGKAPQEIQHDGKYLCVDCYAGAISDPDQLEQWIREIEDPNFSTKPE